MNSHSERLEVHALPPHIAQGLEKIGHPVELSSKFVDQLRDGANASISIIMDEIRNAGGVTELMKPNPVMFGPHILNDPDVNAQLDQRLEAGLRLPLIFDVFATRTNGDLTAKALELQTTTNYEMGITVRMKPVGIDPDHNSTWFGSESPADWYSGFSERFADGEPIVVMDTNPFDDTKIDKFGMQKMVGHPTDVPISPLDILGKDENGYFYHPYKMATDNPFDVARDENGDPVKDTTVTKYAKNILARMGQFDLDELWQKVKDQPEKAALIAQLMTDGSVNWVWHSTWKHIGDKKTMPLIRQRHIEAASPLADQFVPIYGSGEEVTTPGKYIKKPTSAQHGVNQEDKEVKAGEKVIVPDEFVYQGLIEPAPVLVHLQGQYAARMRKPEQETLRKLDEAAGEELRAVTGHMEIRCIMSPYGVGDGKDTPGRFMARLAPRWQAPDSLDRTQTNIGTIKRSVEAHLGDETEALRKVYPFGIGPVVVYQEK